MRPGDRRRGAGRGVWARRAAVAAVLAAHFSLVVFSARHKSATSDEPFHIARGVSALFSGDFRMSVAHPPLVNLISALPLVFFSDLQIPFGDPAWWNPRADEAERKSRFSKELLWVHDKPQWRGNPNPLAIIFWARVPVMVMSVALGLLVYLWAFRLGGTAPGIAALALYAFSPTVLAHAGLATTDLGAALFMTLFAFALDRHLDAPTWKSLVLCAAAFGLAQLSKFTAILLIPLIPAVLILARPNPWRERLREFFLARPKSPAFLTGLFAYVFILVGGALVIWAGYGFELNSIHRLQALELPPLGQPALFLKTFLVDLLAKVPLVPPTYYFGLARTLLDTEAHFHPLYFLGQTSMTGWWYYYPVLFVIKEPLALLALLGLGLASLRQPPAWPRPTRAGLAVFVIGITIFFMFLNRKNIGLRHLLPLYPLLFIWLARLTRVHWRRGILPGGAWALLAAYALNGGLSYPDYLVHFNRLVGGPDGGMRYSVVGEDWGQDIWALGEYCREKGISKIYYNPYGNAAPEAYGATHVRFGCAERPAGWYAVHVVDLHRPLKAETPDCYRDFLSRTPVAVLHHTIYVYEITPVR